jgi:hypothetical protein
MLEEIKAEVNNNIAVDGKDNMTNLVTLVSALRIGDNNWWGTGFAFRLKFANTSFDDTKINAMFKKVATDQVNLVKQQAYDNKTDANALQGSLFKWQQANGSNGKKQALTWDIIVCPPVAD